MVDTCHQYFTPPKFGEVIRKLTFGRWHRSFAPRETIQLFIELLGYSHVSVSRNRSKYRDVFIHFYLSSQTLLLKICEKGVIINAYTETET